MGISILVFLLGVCVWVCFKVMLFVVILWIGSRSAPCIFRICDFFLCGYMDLDLFMGYL